MPIVGTAGHVDHGKSTLVHALTGRDPDRWTEEKERGLTIDLGFAWTEIDGVDIGFVDVPGHERFIKNMLAGVGAVDCALLVIAADSGWMPQTEEHAAVLDLLGIGVGVIALSRVDLVDADTVELATLEIMDETAGTVLAEWPIVPVSPVTGTGIEALQHELSKAIARSIDRDKQPFRMWIDRAFTISGAGVVVTGTLGSGSVSVGDEIEILPQNQGDKVRGLHHHDHAVDRVASGSRTAVNLQTAKLTNVGRGSLLTSPGSMLTSTDFVAELQPARSFDEVPRRGAFHVHVGTSHTPARIRELKSAGVYRIQTDDRLPLSFGDRFILRDSGRQAVVGGGRVLDPAGGYRATPDQLELLRGAADGTPSDRANALLAVRGQASSVDLAMATGGGRATGLQAGGMTLSDKERDRMVGAAETTVSTYHREHPLRPGAPKAELASQLGVSLEVLSAIAEIAPSLSESDGYIREGSFVDQLPAGQLARWDDVRAELERSFGVPRLRDIDLDSETIHSLLRSGDLIQVAPDLAFTKAQIEEIHARLTDLEDGFSVTQFKEAFGMARRQAVPTLEWLDKTGWTKRSGDGRTVRRRP